MHSEILKVSRGIKKRVLEHTLKHNGGYMGQACSSADTLACLYLDIMNLKTIERPLLPPSFRGVPSSKNTQYKNGAEFNGGHEKNYDRFYLSPAQYALVLYALLIETKRMDEMALNDFNKDGSSVEMIGAEHSPGMEVTTGSLGQGLSQAIGSAFARKRNNDLGNNFVFMSDGEFQIGMTYEAIQTMCHYQLDNVIVYVDVNGHQCDGTTTEVMNVKNLVSKVESFGAKAVAVNGHDIEAILNTKKIEHKNQPLFVFCETLPYKDLPEFEKNRPKFHYLRFTSPEEKNIYINALERMSKEWK